MPHLRQRGRRTRLRAAPLNPPREPHATPRIAVTPSGDEGILAAIEEAGGVPSTAGDADGIVWTDASDPKALGRLLESSPARWVQLPFAGIERFVDAGVIDSARSWTCAKGAYAAATAEHALALMLAAARRLPYYARIRSWVEPGPGSPERRLAAATVLVFGAGGIGRALIGMLAPLEAIAIAVNRSGSPVVGARRTSRTEDLGEILPQADWVVITAPLTARTRGLFDAGMLAKMGRESWLVNVARGGIVETDALVKALQEHRIGGAALDVTDPEPLPDGHPLWSLENALVTPHVANTWEMALPELCALVRRNVAHLAAGEPFEGLVDPEAGY